MDNPDQPASGSPPEPVAVVEVNERSESKTERIATMRNELAILQRHLLDAQELINGEVQARADDVARIEQAEARAKAAEAKANESAARMAELAKDNSELLTRVEIAEKAADELMAKHKELSAQLDGHGSSLNDLKAQLAARDTELAARNAELDAKNNELFAKAAEREVEQAALREAKEALATRESELANWKTDRESLLATQARLEGELEELKKAFEAGRGRAQVMANKLATWSTEMLDTVVPEPRPGLPPLPARPSASKPPPIPGARASRTSSTPATEPHDEPVQVEAIPVVAIEPAKAPEASGARGAMLALVGLVVGVCITVAIVKLTADSAPAASEAREVTPPPSASPTEQPAIVTAKPEGALADAPAGSGAAVTPPAEVRTQGVIVLPASAANHRVYIDGKRLEPTNGRIEVLCGHHEIKIGSEGEPQPIEVRCDGDTTFGAP